MSFLTLIFWVEIHQWIQYLHRVILDKPPQVNRGRLWGPGLYFRVWQMYFRISEMVFDRTSCGFRRSAIRHEIEVTLYRVCWFSRGQDAARLRKVHCKFVNSVDGTWINTRQPLYACQGPHYPAAVPGANRPEFMGVTKAVTTVTPPSKPKLRSFWM